MNNDNDHPFSNYYVIPGETMEEYSIRTGIPIGALDKSFWPEKKEENND